MKKYQIDKLFVADVVRVGETYNKRLYKSIFILKDNEFFNVVTGQEMPHSSDCDTDQIGCENVYNCSKNIQTFCHTKICFLSMKFLKLKQKSMENFWKTTKMILNFKKY